MIDLIKKAVLTGVGVAALTKEKIEELSSEIVEKTKMSEEEGEKFIKEMVGRAQESKEALTNQTEQLIQKALSKTNFAKSEEIDQLRGEIENLRTQIEELKAKE